MNIEDLMLRADQKVLRISAEGMAKEKLYSDLMALKRGRQDDETKSENQDDESPK